MYVIEFWSPFVCSKDILPFTKQLDHIHFWQTYIKIQNKRFFSTFPITSVKKIGKVTKFGSGGLVKTLFRPNEHNIAVIVFR